MARNTYQSHICLAHRKTSTHATCLSSEPSQALLILVEKLVILPWARAHTPTYIFATLTLRVCNHMLSTPNIYSMAKVYSSLKYLSKGSMAISKKEKRKRERKEKEEKGLCLPLSKKMMMKREVAMPPTRKDDAKKGVNSTYTTHMHSLGLSLWLLAPFYPSVWLSNKYYAMYAFMFHWPQLHISFSDRDEGNT